MVEYIVGGVILFLVLTFLIFIGVFNWRKNSREAEFLNGEAKQQLFEQKISLDKYLGKWFEVARLPNRFESGCASATAEYTAIDANSFKVFNTCFDENGKVIETVEGLARLNENASQFKDRWAKVAFFGTSLPNLISQIFEGDYLILFVVEDEAQKAYSEAVVGSVDKDYLWILSRSPQISSDRLQQLVDLAAAKGYDVSKLKIN